VVTGVNPWSSAGCSNGNMAAQNRNQSAGESQNRITGETNRRKFRQLQV
jgi:hypothetical protein